MFAIFLALSAALAPPAGEEAAVLTAVEQWLSAYGRKDVASYEALTHPDGVYFVVGELAGRPPIRVGTNRQNLKDLAKPGAHFTERFWNPTVMIRGRLAHVWTPYSFDIDGKRSHCGIDSFSLSKINGKWVMTNSSWTVEPPETSCAELGEPKP